MLKRLILSSIIWGAFAFGLSSQGLHGIDGQALYQMLQAKTLNSSENNYYVEYRNQSGKEQFSVNKDSGRTQVPTGRDIFCAILAGHEQARFLFETDRVIAFLKARDTGNATEALVIPKRHEAQAHLLNQEDFEALAAGCERVAIGLGAQDWSVRVNNGFRQGVPHVHFHFHAVVPGIAIRDRLPMQTIHEWRANPTEWRLNTK